MKVLMVHNFYQSTLTGGEDIVFQREKKSLEANLGHQNVFSYTVCNDSIRLWKLPFQIWMNRRACLDIQTIIKEQSIDLVHVHNFFPILTPQIFVAAKQAGARVVHTLHNYRWWCLSGTLFYKHDICKRCVSKRLMWPGIVRGCYRGSKAQSLLAALAFAWYKRKKVIDSIDAWLVLSEHQRDRVAQWLPLNKIFLKPNAVAQQLDVTPQKQGFVFVGRLEAGKGIEVLCQAWAKFDSSYPLTIIGDGPLRQSLQAKTSHLPIQFLGNLSHKETQHQLAAAKFCIHPSLYYETFGLVMLEAMSLGTPVIGLNIGTRPEFIKHGHNGLLASHDNLSQVIADSVRYDYEKLSANAKKTAQDFREDPVLNQQVKVYEEVLSS